MSASRSACAIACTCARAFTSSSSSLLRRRSTLAARRNIAGSPVERAKSTALCSRAIAPEPGSALPGLVRELPDHGPDISSGPSGGSARESPQQDLLPLPRQRAPGQSLPLPVQGGVAGASHVPPARGQRLCYLVYQAFSAPCFSASRVVQQQVNAHADLCLGPMCSVAGLPRFLSKRFGPHEVEHLEVNALVMSDFT